MRILKSCIQAGSLALAVLIGPFALAGARAQPVATAEPAPPARQAAPDGAPAAQDGYLKLCQLEMRDWKLRLDRFSQKTSASGQKEAQAMQRDLSAAWAKTETDANKLRTSSAAGWDDARLAYERSAQALAVAWDKILPEDK